MERMARQEADRDDLYEEFQSATLKWELIVPGFEPTWVVGIRRDERISFYCGPDPCYHFDAENSLQRAYVQGALYRTQGTTLARLIRERSSAVTQLTRYDLDESEMERFREELLRVLSALDAAIENSTVEILRYKSPVDFPSSVQPRLQEIIQKKSPLAPAYPTRKR